MVLLDTDLLTRLERGGADAMHLLLRLDQLSPSEVATTIISYEEQTRGWMSRIGQASATTQIQFMYRMLAEHIDTFCDIKVVPFEKPAIDIYLELKQSKLRIGTMDLKIAAIAIANDATLLTRNLSDFQKVPGLKVEDWSI